MHFYSEKLLKTGTTALNRKPRDRRCTMHRAEGAEDIAGEVQLPPTCQLAYCMYIQNFSIGLCLTLANLDSN